MAHFYEFIKAEKENGNAQWLSLVRRRQDFEQIRNLLTEREIFWFDQPVRVGITDMTWFKNCGKIKKPGQLSFELYNGFTHTPEGWNHPFYPDPYAMRIQSKEIEQEIKKATGLMLDRGANDVLVIYKIGARGDANISPEQWKNLVDTFTSTIVRLGHKINVKQN